MAVGIHTLGYRRFFELLFDLCGMTVDDGTLHYLKKQQKARHERMVDGRKSESKKKRQAKLYRKLKKHHEKLRKDKAQGIHYQPGVGMTDPAEAAERLAQKAANEARDQPPGDKPAGMDNNNWCKACRQWGHRRRNSKLCAMNPKQQSGKDNDYEDDPTTAVPDSDAIDAETLDLLDEVPLSNDLHEDLVDLESDAEDSE